jgi:hypothetical protein
MLTTSTNNLLVISKLGSSILLLVYITILSLCSLDFMNILLWH